jgi:hypothetical protein
MTERDEDVMASFIMVRSLLVSTENKMIIKQNNLGLAFEIRMMFLSRNLR